ncbi:receptor-like serine/threonine-protein kinase SD1-8 isoform X3 [Carex rostrata]
MWNKTSFKQFVTVLLLFSLLLVSYSLDTTDKTKKLVHDQTLVSSQGQFVLGFFNRGTPAKWYVGIWYNVTPDIVVWIANRDYPLNDSSSTLAVSNGSIVLIDSSQNTTLFDFNSPVDKAFDPMMQLLDSGNLVIKGPNGDENLWQSFDHPSNTMLPGMKIGKNLTSGSEWYLTSWKSSNDPSKGNYRYKMDTLGLPEIVLWNDDRINFKTGAWNGLRFSGLPEMATYANMVSFNFSSTTYEISYSFEADMGTPMLRVVLNETGVLRRMIWDQSSKTWSNFWSWPSDMCDDYGTCGPFGICNFSEHPICDCLPGFKEKSPSEWSMRNFSGGCELKTPLSCQANSNGFQLVKSVKLPDTKNATVDASISIKECKRKCLANCSCWAYSLFDIKGGRGCITWGKDLVDIRYVENGQDLYIKLDKSDLAATGKKKILLLIGMIGISTVLISVIVLLIYLRLMKKKIGVVHLGKTKMNYNDRSSLRNTELPIYDMQKVMSATANFSEANKLGQGGFGIVYKGVLTNGEEIAVKRLSKGSSQGLNEFMNEVMLIAKLQHRNLVKLLGCCIHGAERMLIYEFMPNKSLDFFIFDKVSRELVGWSKRLEIVTGISRGILYLHQDSRLNIIHRDLKAANILLDGKMAPKISDFGIARLFKQEQHEMDTERVVGTRGYMSPEYAMEGKISVKSDVYSFGVLLLEIISGKRNQGDHNLLAYAWQLWQEGNITNFVDEAIESSTCVASEILRFVHVGLLCVQECADDRPTMSTVVSMLSNEGCSLPEPKKPVLSTKFIPEGLYSANELTVTGLEGR